MREALASESLDQNHDHRPINRLSILLIVIRHVVEPLWYMLVVDNGKRTVCIVLLLIIMFHRRHDRVFINQAITDAESIPLDSLRLLSNFRWYLFRPLSFSLRMELFSRVHI